MAEKQSPPACAASTREERLAAKLRENLRRRKAQARVLDGRESGPGGDDKKGGEGSPNAALSKEPLKS